MKKLGYILIYTITIILLTILSQIGGIALLISEYLAKRLFPHTIRYRLLSFVAIYIVFTFVLVPLTAPWFGREKVQHKNGIRPTTYLTIVLNRNYVRPALNDLLQTTAQKVAKEGIAIRYLDANFPFINKFPLLPHLSHNDGKKIDLSFIYETKKGELSTKQKSNSGYGVFESPLPKETNQPERCIQKGYWQYDYPKFLTLGRKNADLVLSNRGTKRLINTILNDKRLGKLFIEPHLKNRLQLQHPKVRYHGCKAVRHDDHIHIQLK